MVLAGGSGVRPVRSLTSRQLSPSGTWGQGSGLMLTMGYVPCVGLLHFTALFTFLCQICLTFSQKSMLF